MKARRPLLRARRPSSRSAERTKAPRRWRCSAARWRDNVETTLAALTLARPVTEVMRLTGALLRKHDRDLARQDWLLALGETLTTRHGPLAVRTRCQESSGGTFTLVMTRQELD